MIQFFIAVLPVTLFGNCCVAVFAVVIGYLSGFVVGRALGEDGDDGEKEWGKWAEGVFWILGGVQVVVAVWFGFVACRPPCASGEGNVGGSGFLRDVERRNRVIVAVCHVLVFMFCFTEANVDVAEYFYEQFGLDELFCNISFLVLQFIMILFSWFANNGKAFRIVNAIWALIIVYLALTRCALVYTTKNPDDDQLRTILWQNTLEWVLLESVIGYVAHSASQQSEEAKKLRVSLI